MIEIIEKELEDFPKVIEGKYPKELWGKCYGISGLDNGQYCQKNGTMTWGIPTELIDRIKTLTDNPSVEESVSVDDLTILRKSFDLQDIIRLRKEGLI